MSVLLSRALSRFKAWLPRVLYEIPPAATLVAPTRSLDLVAPARSLALTAPTRSLTLVATPR